MRILTIPQITQDVDIELGPDAPCSLSFVKNRRPFCDRPAEWACLLSCCGNVKTVCGEHRDIAASILPRIFLCVICGMENPQIFRAWRI